MPPEEQTAKGPQGGSRQTHARLLTSGKQLGTTQPGTPESGPTTSTSLLRAHSGRGPGTVLRALGGSQGSGSGLRRRRPLPQCSQLGHGTPMLSGCCENGIQQRRMTAPSDVWQGRLGKGGSLVGFETSEHLAPPPARPGPTTDPDGLWISRAILSSSCPKEPGSGGWPSAGCRGRGRKAGVSWWSSPPGSTSVRDQLAARPPRPGSNSSCSGLGLGRGGAGPGRWGRGPRRGRRTTRQLCRRSPDGPGPGRAAAGPAPGP